MQIVISIRQIINFLKLLLNFENLVSLWLVMSCKNIASLWILLPSWLGLLNTLTASLQRGKTSHQWVSWYDTKQSDGKVPVMLELWGIQGTPSLPSLPGLLWPGVVAPNRVLSMGQIKLNCTYAKLNCLK